MAHVYHVWTVAARVLAWLAVVLPSSSGISGCGLLFRLDLLHFSVRWADRSARGANVSWSATSTCSWVCNRSGARIIALDFECVADGRIVHIGWLLAAQWDGGIVQLAEFGIGHDDVDDGNMRGVHASGGEFFLVVLFHLLQGGAFGVVRILLVACVDVPNRFLPRLLHLEGDGVTAMSHNLDWVLRVRGVTIDVDQDGIRRTSIVFGWRHGRRGRWAGGRARRRAVGRAARRRCGRARRWTIGGHRWA
mmetsp:Transcript_12502/g.36329  ORF Transcript_12502/g.36329 Transcript_12502/m.36329 type:complete len:249 (-) Transcript_12502:1543-2289(-)